MSVLAEVVARMRAALGKTGQARQALNQAGDLLDEANESFIQALAGSSDPEAEQVVGLFARLRPGLNDTYRLLIEAENRTRSYLDRLEAEPAPAVANRVPSLPERIEQLRVELPPPVVRSSGRKTHGRWIAPDGSAQPLVSGRDELSSQVNDALRAQGYPWLPARTADDVELKLAALMRGKGEADPRMRHVTVVLNNRPGKGDLSCDELIPVILPEGYSLTVYAPNYRKKFTGGASPWWR